MKTCEEEKLITILDMNKKYFKKGEKVELYVEIKNQNKIVVKVFEIQMENYYKKHFKQINQTMNLDGLIALLE